MKAADLFNITASRSKSVVVNVRLSEDLLQRLAAFGNAQQLNLTDTLRALLEEGLAATKEETHVHQ